MLQAAMPPDPDDLLPISSKPPTWLGPLSKSGSATIAMLCLTYLAEQRTCEDLDRLLLEFLQFYLNIRLQV